MHVNANWLALRAEDAAAGRLNVVIEHAVVTKALVALLVSKGYAYNVIKHPGGVVRIISGQRCPHCKGSGTCPGP